MARYVADEDHDLIEAAQSAGAAAEYLLRALLCLHDPALLAARNHPVSLIALSRANANSALDIQSLRTISYGEALDLLRLIHPTLNIDSDVRYVMELRNAAAHMAMTDGESLKQAALRLVQIVSKIHAHLSRSEADFWGDPLASLIRAMQDERATALARTVEAKFTRARQVIAELTRELSPGDAEAVLIAREARSVRWSGDDEEERECPVCHRHGWFVVSTDRGDPYSYEYSDDTFWQVEIYRWAGMFQCPVCDLVLDYDELPLAGLPHELESRYEDVEDPYLNWEPDEDYLRGR